MKKALEASVKALFLLEGCLCYIFASLLLILTESNCETKKKVFYVTSKALSFSRKSKFRTLDVMTSSNA